MNEAESIEELQNELAKLDLIRRQLAHKSELIRGQILDLEASKPSIGVLSLDPRLNMRLPLGLGMPQGDERDLLSRPVMLADEHLNYGGKLIFSFQRRNRILGRVAREQKAETANELPGHQVPPEWRDETKGDGF